MIQNVILLYNKKKSKIKVNQSLTDKCSVKHRLELKVSQFDVPPFAGENRDIQAVRKTLWDLTALLYCINTDRALAVVRTKYD